MRLSAFSLACLCAAIAACGLSATGTGTGIADDSDGSVDGGQTPIGEGGSFVMNGEGGITGPDAAVMDGGLGLVTTISPWDPSGTLTYGIAIDWTIASDPPQKIYVTTDGTTPTTASSNGGSPVKVHEPKDNTTIKWIVGTDPTVHQFLVHVDPALQGQTTGMVSGFSFANDNSSTIIHAAPGKELTGKVADTWAWNAQSQQNDVSQLVYGVSAVVGCFTDEVPDVYNGKHHTDRGFTVTAPTAPGVYPVMLGFQLQYRCTPDAIGKPLGKTQLGLIIVP